MTACTAPRHGTWVDYQHGGCRCPKARESWRLYAKRVREGRQPPGLLPSIGTSRRVQALMAIDHTADDIAQASGVHVHVVRVLGRGARSLVQRAVAEKIAAAYDRLSMIPGTSSRTGGYARRKGFAPPLAWDDASIDDPDAQPLVAPEANPEDVDEVAVARVVNGGSVRGLSKAERLAVARLMAKNGIGPAIIAKRINYGFSAVKAILGEAA